MGILRLQAVELADLARWRWVLTDDSGAFVADHEVRLDVSSWQFEAFADLSGYLSWNVAPDRRTEEEARIVSAVGEWIRSEVLGPVAGALVKARPATVRVTVPAGAEELLARPLELGHVGGKPLAAQNVTFVMDTGPDERGVSQVGERLRVLGLFSLPEGGQALNLRRERYSLVQLIERIAADGKAADIRVLQYGVTRDQLRDVLADEEGWDVVHVSGHGSPGRLLLETDEGKPDQVTAPQLAELLDSARGRLKLVTISACGSADPAVASQRRLLGLPLPDEPAPQRTPGLRGANPASGSFAIELARRLNCAVLAMRYQVSDEFAIALGWKLYTLLADEGQPLPAAVGMTLRELASRAVDTVGNGPAFPALSAATPALFGRRAVDLRLAAPDSAGAADDARSLKMAGFPPQAARFIGRTSVMTRASAALAAKSGVPGVLLLGMPGGGKTACALELAYVQEHAFDQLIWYKAPDEGMDITSALTDFALILERYFAAFQMAHVLVDDDQLTAFLPQLTKEMAQHRLLLVIDNAESLISDNGLWHDERWGRVIGALCGHSGAGRVVLTSRRAPGDTTALRVEGVDALSADETLLLASELSNLNALKLGQTPGIDRLAGRQLTRRALDIAQGHPKLLELAEGQAAHPERLAALLEAGDQAWRRQGGVPAGFFTTGEGTASGEDYLHLLAAWTRSVTDILPAGERDLFWFLCCLEEPDRERPVLNGNWDDLWSQLGRDGQPPGLDQALSALSAQSLAGIRAPTDGNYESYLIHPGVAATGRAHAGKPFQDAVDAETFAYWDDVYQHAFGLAGDGSVHTGLLVRAGLAAVPYLIRQQQWRSAANMLERALSTEPSRQNTAAMLPAIQQIASHDPRHAGVLARVLEVIAPATANARLRAHLDAAVARGEYQAASAAATQLVNQYVSSGRLAEALTLTGQAIGYTRHADAGPWTQLQVEVQRLGVLNAMGQAKRVPGEVKRLRRRMRALPATAGPDENVAAWHVREKLLDTDRDAARQLGRWRTALGLNAEVIDSMRDRRALATEIARARFNDYGPLLMLGRADDALELLLDCRQAFQDSVDYGTLGRTLTALAHTEDARGHGDATTRLERDALRYKFLAGDVIGIATSYHNLGTYLHRQDRQPALALACHLASALISAFASIDDNGESVDSAAADLYEFDTAAILPTDLADLERQVGEIPGTDLTRLIGEISPSSETAERTLQGLIAQAEAQALAARRSATASAKWRWWWPWGGDRSRSA